MRPNFEVCRRRNKVGRHYKCNKAIDKPWFTTELKSRYNTYRAALAQFNYRKNKEKHLVLMETKHLESKLEHQYLRKEGDLLECLQKHDPKIFFKCFRKRKLKNILLDLKSFHYHFKDLGNSTPTVNTDSFTMEDTGTTVFDELDKEITEKEIDEAIKCLKRGNLMVWIIF
jgi:hypothetical protein